MKPPADAVLSYVNTSQRLADRSITPPSVLHAVDPIYPPKASKDLVQGMVIVEGVVGTDGRARDLVAIDGAPVFQQAALKAVGQYTFKAATRNGQPVPVVINITVNFQIY